MSIDDTPLRDRDSPPNQTIPATLDPLRAIRATCVDCAGSNKAITYCPCDGVNSVRCELWPYRFGIRPSTARKRYGDAVTDPRSMPSVDTDLDSLPKNPRNYDPSAR